MYSKILVPLDGTTVAGEAFHRRRRTGRPLSRQAPDGGTFLAINLHLAISASHPWLIPGTGFDEGIDLDSVLPAIQIVIAAVSIIFLQRLRQERAHMIALHRRPSIQNDSQGREC